MSAEIEQLRQQHEKFQTQFKKPQEDPMQRIGRLQDELVALEATAKSPSGKVIVTAGPGGSIRHIQFTEDAVSLGSSALAAEVTSTLQQAVAQAARQQARLVDEHMGGQLNAYDQVLKNQAEAFGTTVEELNKALEQAPKAPPKPPKNEDDFSENTLMSKGHKPPPPIGAPPAPPASSAPPAGGSKADKFLKNLFSEDDQ